MPKQITACYLRVSTRNGRQKTDSQKLALRRYVRTSGFKSVKWYEDRASGRNAARDDFQAILELVREGKVDHLVVWKLDRLSRSLPDMLTTFQLLLSHGCTLHVTSQNLILDAASPFASFLVGLFGLLGRLESDLTSERIKAGLEAAKAKGQRLGAPVRDRQREKIRKWQESGVAVSTIAKRLGRSRQAVYSMIGRMKQESASQ